MMANRFFFWSLVIVGLITLLGSLAFSFFGIFLITNKQLTNKWIEKVAKKEGLKIGWVELKGNEQH